MSLNLDPFSSISFKVFFFFLFPYLDSIFFFLFLPFFFCFVGFHSFQFHLIWVHKCLLSYIYFFPFQWNVFIIVPNFNSLGIFGKLCLEFHMVNYSVFWAKFIPPMKIYLSPCIGVILFNYFLSSNINNILGFS